MNYGYLYFLMLYNLIQLFFSFLCWFLFVDILGKHSGEQEWHRKQETRNKENENKNQFADCIQLDIDPHLYMCLL